MAIRTMVGIGIAAIAVIGCSWYAYRVYNELTWHKEKVDKIAGNLDAVLQRKYDQIPALLNVVKGYATHEKGIFEKVTELRSQWGSSSSSRQKVKTANQIETALSKIIALKENYPRLKADKNFRSIHKSISSADKAVMNERKYYNEVVRRFNVRVKLFPRNIIARLFGFRERPYFSREQ